MGDEKRKREVGYGDAAERRCNPPPLCEAMADKLRISSVLGMKEFLHDTHR